MKKWKYASNSGKKTLDLLRKHGAKTGKELRRRWQLNQLLHQLNAFGLSFHTVQMQWLVYG